MGIGAVINVNADQGTVIMFMGVRLRVKKIHTLKVALLTTRTV